MALDIAHVYQIDECLDWIIENQHKRVILQFKNEDLKDSVNVKSLLEIAYDARLKDSASLEKKQSLDLYVTQSNTCCVDLIVTQHVSNVDAIVHFGKVCLSKPHLENQDQDKPVLYVLTHVKQDSQTFESNVQQIINHLESITSANSNWPVCLLYDSNLVDYAKAISEIIKDKNLNKSVEVAKLICPSRNWCVSIDETLCIIDSQHSLGQYGLLRPVDRYQGVLYLGDRLSIRVTLQGPRDLWKVNCYTSMELEKVNVSRVLNKRMALVDRLRDDLELKIGVIITNPLPHISEIMTILGEYAKARKHTLYFISMIQTIDECKIGNFDLCDAFVVINSCTCSTILESLYFNRPIINGLEFKLACGFEAVYGRVLWPSSSCHLTADDLVNKRRVSDVSLALVHSRNELLERCSRARINMWSGLDYKAGAGSDKGISCVGVSEVGGGESLNIEEGLHGIASTYVSEPLKKSAGGEKDNQQGVVVSSDNTVSTVNMLNIDDLILKNNNKI